MTATDAELRNRLVELTRDLILVPSIADHPEEMARCFELVRHHLDVLPGIVIKEFSIKGHVSMLILPEGLVRPDVLMCAHLDVIAHPNRAVYKSVIEGGRIVGPGAGDMKGALAILIELLKYFYQHHAGCSLGLVITSDEEQGGESGIGHLVRHEDLRCGVALIPDGGSPCSVTVAEKGIIHCKIIHHGHSAHAARPWLGENAIEQLLATLSNVTALFEEASSSDNHWVPTCSVNVIATPNQTVNRVPSEAVAILDIRFPPPYTVDKMKLLMEDVIDEEAELEWLITAEPASLDPDPMFMEAIHEVHGSPPEKTKEAGGSDGRFFSAQGIPVIISRPLVGELHGPEEWIDIDSMISFYSVCKKYLEKKLA